MPELLLDQIRSQICDRVRALEPVAREYERLDAALTALGGPVEARRPTPVPAPVSNRRPGMPASGRRAGTGRAPRGANRSAVLGVLAERPGVSASELSTAAGVGRAVLYALLKTLEERGEVAREELPGGTAGYRLASDASGAPANVASSGTAGS